MTVAEHPAFESDVVSAELRASWETFGLKAFWESDVGPIGPIELPRHWKWSDMRPIMAETAKLTLEHIAERRVLHLVSPTNPIVGPNSTCGLLMATLQVLSPGEVARVHRHPMNALRFILEGNSAETIVGGKPCKMEAGDLIITPAWAWHEHRHPGNTQVFWLDILDVNLHWALGTRLIEVGSDLDIKINDNAIDASAFDRAKYVPTLTGPQHESHSPTYRYPWAEALAAVQRAPAAPDGSRRIRYANPLNGGPVMDMIDCYLIEIEKGKSTTPFKSSASSICSVVDGIGSSQSGDLHVQWSSQDTFTVPANTWVTHKATSDKAHIFIATDREVYRRLDLLNETSGV